MPDCRRGQTLYLKMATSAAGGYFYYLIDHLLLQLGKREAQSETHLANET